MEAAGAIADPVRREVLTLLRTEGPMTAGRIAARFAISRPAVSRHLRVLREAGLVVDEPRGRERVYRLDARPLAALDAWLAPFRPSWAARLEAGLDALATEVRRTGRDRRARGPAPGSSQPPGTVPETDAVTVTDTEERSA